MTPKTIALIGTFDTKGEEFSFLRERIESAGLRTLMIDVGVLGSPSFKADISQAEVAAAANENLAALQTERDRGRSVTAMAVGAKAILARLFQQGTIHGVVSLGGSAGTAIATAAMRALPCGFPKLMVSTLASGDIKPYVGTTDICMMPSVLDIAGLNHVSRRIIGNAAAAICGMVASEPVRRPRPEARHCGHHVRRHHTLRHGRTPHPRGERLRSSRLSRHRRRRTSDGAVDRRRRISSRSRHHHHRTRRRTGRRCHERRPAPAGSGRPQGHSSSCLPRRHRHGELRPDGIGAAPVSQPQSLHPQPQRHSHADHARKSVRRLDASQPPGSTAPAALSPCSFLCKAFPPSTRSEHRSTRRRRSTPIAAP